jgi:hypothetical protein
MLSDLSFVTAAASSRSSVRVVDGVARDQADVPAVLVGEHAPAVDFLFVDPAVTVEGRADQRGRHRDERVGNDRHRVEYRQRSTLPRTAGRLVSGAVSADTEAGSFNPAFGRQHCHGHITSPLRRTGGRT